MKRLFVYSFILFAAAACNKEEGLGGTAVIEGQVFSVDHDFSKNEITDVTFTNGNQVEHGDYWLLNTPDQDSFFYVWYDNPTWITPGDPQLQGRTGIQVVFNYSDSNVEIAANTKAAILSATSLFDITQVNDILSFSCTVNGECHDAEDVSSPFSIDIAQQGNNGFLGTESEAADERVYIVYGADEEVYSDEMRTSSNGGFKFTNLTRGDYQVFVYTKDTVSGGNVILTQDVTITDKKEVLTLDGFHIYR